MDKPLISVVVPVYNVEAYLEKCMASLLEQTYSNIEVILVDDGSTDASGDICDQYAEMDLRVQSVRLAKNSGVSHARNEGIRRAKGELISFVDPDDYVDKTILAFLYSSLVESKADISVCGVERIGFEANTPNFLDSPVLFSRDEMFFSMLRHEILVGVVGKLFPLALVKKLSFHEEIHFGEDLLFLYQLLQHIETACYMPDTLYYYVRRADSATQNLSHERYYTLSYAYEYFYQESLKKFPQFAFQLKLMIVNMNVRTAIKAVENRTVKGKQLYAYLKMFQEKVRKYCSREVLAKIHSPKTVIGALLLFANARVFWVVTAIYKRIRAILIKLIPSLK